jgi:hypothetical protein
VLNVLTMPPTVLLVPLKESKKPQVVHVTLDTLNSMVLVPHVLIDVTLVPNLLTIVNLVPNNLEELTLHPVLAQLYTMMMVKLPNVKNVGTVVPLVLLTQIVTPVKKEESLPQNVDVLMLTSIPVLLPVNNVIGNVSLVSTLLITV